MIVAVLAIAALSTWATLGLFAEFVGVAEWPRSLRRIADAASTPGSRNTPVTDGRDRGAIAFPVRAVRLAIGLLIAIGGQVFLVLLAVSRARELGTVGILVVLVEVALFLGLVTYLVSRSLPRDEP